MSIQICIYVHIMYVCTRLQFIIAPSLRIYSHSLLHSARLCHLHIHNSSIITLSSTYSRRNHGHSQLRICSITGSVKRIYTQISMWQWSWIFRNSQIFALSVIHLLPIIEIFWQKLHGDIYNRMLRITIAT